MTATGAAGHSGEPAAGLVVGELAIGIDSATNLGMGGRVVEDKQTIAGVATLRAVQ